MTESSARNDSVDDLVRCIRYLHGRGWCDGTSGNYSLTVGVEPLRLLISASGVDKGKLDRSSLLVVDETGQPQDSTPLRPSAETRLHIELSKRFRPGAILHTHSIWGTLLGRHFESTGGFRLEGYEMLKGIRGIATHAAEVFVPVVPNSQDMDRLAVEFRQQLDRHPDSRGILIAGHGFYTWGVDLDEARRHVEVFEFLFQLAGRRVALEPFRG